MELTPGQIMAGLTKQNQLLTSKNDEYQELIAKRAEAERVYNIAVSEKTIALRMSDTPVSIISSQVKGDKTIAMLKYEYDVALGVEKACLQSIKAYMSAIDTYRSLLSWLKAELQSN